ncbi:cytochrome P450 [Mycobacterium sp. URHB0044]|uniref:cytochrome P450 n=1 Tax=Mycobacterium sp. URHB0044 TaxID=1380386 RepID=UPI000491F77B|nr:cytochrome P450 [Mycobacterium sp. URHB0044]
MSTDQLTDAPYLNLADPAFSVQSGEVRAAREQSWYARTPYGLAVLRYDEVGKLMKDRRLRQGSWAWPAHNGVTEGAFAHWWSRALLNIEGEDHHRLRRLMNPAFSPKLIGGLVPRFQALANELIDDFYADGHCDFAAQFAEPYAARVIAIMLGIDESEWRRIAAWSNDIGLALGVTLKQDLDRVETALAGLYGYADELIADRTEHPRDDFVSRLVLAERDGEHLSRDELRVALVLLIFGGMDTTRNQLGLALQTFMTYPDQWDLLARHPELGKAAVEEVMRVNPTVTWVTREALEDFDYQGLHIVAGTTIHLLSESAGTDPRVIDGEPFDLQAERPPHFGFGGGMHHCLGHFVARSDMSEALPLLASRLKNPRINGTATSLPLSGNTGPIHLPIAFDRI